MTTSPVEWKTCRNGHTGYMQRHPSKPNSLSCVFCVKRREGEKYQEKRRALVRIYSQLLAATHGMTVKQGGEHLAKLAVLTTLRKKITNLGGDGAAVSKESA